MTKLTARRFGGALGLTLSVLALATGLLHAQQPKLRVGLMLPYSGTYAALGNAISNGFKLSVQEQGG
jgi:branched-chain amino acid transport system substrate-binding protein